MKDEFCNKITYAKKWATKKNIKKVVALLEKYPSQCFSDCPTSWVDEVTELLDKITFDFSNIKIVQFKEKLGTLRVYFSGSKDEEQRNEIEKMIDITQNKLIRKLKYPYKIAKCKNCGHESMYASMNWAKDLEPFCSYCKEEIK